MRGEIAKLRFGITTVITTRERDCEFISDPHPESL
jgi:hypothetical protein